MYIKLCLLLLVVFIVNQGSTEAKVKECRYAKDCGRSECCVVQSTLKGRRKRALPLGTCQPMGGRKAYCFVKPMTDSNGAYYNHCPCHVTHTCRPNGNVEIPLGEQGNCVSQRKG